MGMFLLPYHRKYRLYA